MTPIAKRNISTLGAVIFVALNSCANDVLGFVSVSAFGINNIHSVGRDCSSKKITLKTAQSAGRMPPLNYFRITHDQSSTLCFSSKYDEGNDFSSGRQAGSDKQVSGKKSSSKRRRLRNAVRKIFFTAALSSSMWMKGRGTIPFQPPAAHAGMAKKGNAPVEVESGSKVGGRAKILPVVAIAGGVLIAKRMISDDENNDSARSLSFEEFPITEDDEGSDEEKEALRKLMNQKKDAPIDEDLQKVIKEREARRDARADEDQRRTDKEKGRELAMEQVAIQIKADKEATLKAKEAAEEEKLRLMKEREEKARIRAEAEAKAALEAKKKAEQEEEARLKEEADAVAAAAMKEAALKAKAEEEARLAMLDREEEEAQLTSEMEVEAKKVREDEEREERLVAEANAARIKAVEDKQIQEAKLKAEQEKIAMEMIDPAEKYAAIKDEGDRAFQILLDLGLVQETPDPDDPNYDSSADDEYV